MERSLGWWGGGVQSSLTGDSAALFGLTGPFGSEKDREELLAGVGKIGDAEMEVEVMMVGRWKKAGEVEVEFEAEAGEASGFIVVEVDVVEGEGEAEAEGDATREDKSFGEEDPLMFAIVLLVVVGVGAGVSATDDDNDAEVATEGSGVAVVDGGVVAEVVEVPAVCRIGLPASVVVASASSSVRLNCSDATYSSLLEDDLGRVMGDPMPLGMGMKPMR